MSNGSKIYTAPPLIYSKKVTYTIRQLLFKGTPALIIILFPSLFFLQMIRKSVETRDWLNTIEPRNVRSVMKRLVEEIASIDKQVGLLYEEGFKKTEGSGIIKSLGH